MAVTEITKLYRATIFARCQVAPSNLQNKSKQRDAATERMSKLEETAEKLANKHGVEFKSLNTQVLYDGTFELEAADKNKLTTAVEAIEACVLKTKGGELLDA